MSDTKAGPHGSNFRDVLTKLSNDPLFRNQATQDPNLITGHFDLSLKELEALHQAAVLSGADLTKVETVRDEQARAGGAAMAEAGEKSCCCCCCCCGDTGVSITG